MTNFGWVKTGHEGVLHALNRRSEHEGPAPPTTDDVDERDYVGNGRIRCPVCRWRPRRSDRWGCSCGWEWNTFETRGRCPVCAYRWLETQCLSCERWSPHEDWYEAGEPGRKPD
jgi:hypothetical protein